MLKHIPETYEIIGKIGSGKSGDVYKAYHKNLRTYVVLKKVKTELRNLVNNRAEVDVLKICVIPGFLRSMTFWKWTEMCILL